MISYQPYGTSIGTVDGQAVYITYPDGQIELITTYGSAHISEEEVYVATITIEDEDFETLWAKWSE